MRCRGPLLSSVLAASAIAAASAQAQVEQTREFHQLPDNDFTWNWGKALQDVDRESPGFRAQGFEAEFECELEGRLLANSKGAYQRIEPREFADDAKDLRLSMFFIWDATAMMNGFERWLDWATLVCTRREIHSEGNPQRKGDETRKMQREVDRRREQAAHADH
jgi:hypothetical protein